VRMGIQSSRCKRAPRTEVSERRWKGNSRRPRAREWILLPSLGGCEEERRSGQFRWRGSMPWRTLVACTPRRQSDSDGLRGIRARLARTRASLLRTATRTAIRTATCAASCAANCAATRAPTRTATRAAASSRMLRRGLASSARGCSAERRLLGLQADSLPRCLRGRPPLGF
jgi:hypothetical protein